MISQERSKHKPNGAVWRGRYRELTVTEGAKSLQVGYTGAVPSVEKFLVERRTH